MASVAVGFGFRLDDRSKVLQCGCTETCCSEVFLLLLTVASPQAHRTAMTDDLNVATDCQQSGSPSLPSIGLCACNMKSSRIASAQHLQTLQRLTSSVLIGLPMTYKVAFKGPISACCHNSAPICHNRKG